MNILDYHTSGGKNVIKTYTDALPEVQRTEILEARQEISEFGLEAFEKLNTRQLVGKLWEIKLSQNRVMYVIADRDNVAFLHICKKQKGKAAKHEIRKAVKRAKKEGLM